MKYNELIILLPCHSIEDFPLHHEGDRAEGLLACWTALWHPALIASAGTMPAWRRADEPIDSLADKLVVIPQVSEDDLPSGFAARAEKEGACVVRNQTSRDAILQTALARLDGGDTHWNAELVADFLALGYCHLQVELLTRLMRYASSLDEIHFQDQLLEAARAAAEAGEDPEAVQAARDQLRACFDTLAEERDHYYPVDSFILDLTVVAPSTMGASLRHEMASGVACNVLITADTLSQMEREEPESLALLREGIANEQVCVLGGELGEPELPLMSAEEVLGNLREAAAVYNRVLGRSPTVYGRRRHGLTPLLPQLLKSMGFNGALHATLDDGRFPEGTQARTQWEGIDGTELNSLARVPLDAGQPETFLKLASTVGEYMDTDHTAVVLLAHWPGKASPWYDDLRRISGYVRALGTMTTFEQLFHETEYAGHTDRFSFDQYRCPYLVQDVRQQQIDPISRHARSARRRARAEACQSLHTVASLLRQQAETAVVPALEELDAPAAAPPDPAQEPSEVPVKQDRGSDTWEDRLADSLAQTATDLGNRLAGGEEGGKKGCLVINPLSYARRVGVCWTSRAGLPAAEKPVLATGESQGRAHAVVDVPAMGYAWLGESGSAAGSSTKLAKPLAEENVVRNEFMEAWINPDTGSLRAIYDYRSRGNRLSQQIGFRGSGPARESDDPLADPDELADYSIMAADRVEVTASTPALGEITASGRLVSHSGDQVATFTQVYRLWRGSRVLWLGVELQPKVEPLAQPWKSYFACRFAWPDSAANLYRSMHGCRRPTKSRRLESPDYVEIESGEQRIAILAGGLAYHRRVGLRMLDTLLIVKGETARHFSLGVGLDVTHPHREALGMLTDPITLEQVSGPPAAGDANWMFHVDTKNVVATRWEPLLDEQRTVGYRVRLLETTGRKAKTRLRALRDVSSAQVVDFRGQPRRDCAVEGDAVLIELGPFEWAEIEARW